MLVGLSEREHPRYAHQAKVTLRTAGRSHEGRTTNLSRGGLCAELEIAVPLGTEVELDLQLVFDEAASEALTLVARVVWCTPLDGGHQLGFAFKPPRGDTAAYLAMFLRYLDDRTVVANTASAELTIDDLFR